MSILAGHMSAGSFRLLDLISSFDRMGGSAYVNAKSTAHFLSWQCGLDMRTAREHVRVARALRQLPHIAGALRRGEISYSKTRTATHVERTVRLSRRHCNIESDRRVAMKHRAERHLSCRWEEDGALSFQGRLPPEEGKLLLQALKAARDQIRDEQLHGDRREVAFDESTESSHPVEQNGPAGASRSDALSVIAESFLANGPAALNGAERYQVFVHIDESADGATDERTAPARHQLDDDVPLPRAVARRITCDCSKMCLHHDGVRDDGSITPLSIGRRTRQVPTAIRRALDLRDRGCRFPGCNQRRFVDAHHIQHWADGGETSLANLVLLCRHHHRAVHEGGWSIDIADDGQLLFADRNGRLWPAVPRPPPIEGHPIQHLVDTHRVMGLHITCSTIIPKWDGVPMNYGLALDQLVRRRLRALQGPPPEN